MRTLLVLAPLLLVFGAGLGYARAEKATNESPFDSLFVAPKIVVEAKRFDPTAELFNRPGFVALVDLGKRRDRFEDLSTVLAQQVGITVKQYGGYGSLATASIRGSSAGQVNVYLDGIPLNDPYLGPANLADLPLGGVQSLEIYRGFSPPHLGSSAIGGAVNLVTSTAGRWENDGLLSHLEVNETYGSFDTSRHRLSAWSQPWKIRLFTHGGYTRTLGKFPFLDDKGTPYNRGDDSLSTRVNNDFESYNFFGRCEAPIPRFGAASLCFDRFYRDQGIPGIGTYQSTTARAKRGRSLAYFSLKSSPELTGRIQISGTTFYSKSIEQCSDPAATISPRRQDTDNTILAHGGTTRAKWFVPVLPVSAELVFEGRKEKFHPVKKLPSLQEGPDYWRRSSTVAFTAEVYLLHQALVLSGTQRWLKHINEFYDVPIFAWLPPTPQGKIARQERTPSVGFRWHPRSFLTVKGNTGTYYRLPTFLELFGNFGSVTGNAKLAPEKGTNRDLGVVLSFDRLGPLRTFFLETVYLTNDAENLILFFPNSQRTSIPANIGAAEIRGWEVSFSACVGSLLQLSGNYASLDTRDTSEIPYYHGNKLPSRPEHEFSLSASVPLKWWRLSYELHHIGANYLDRANMQEIPARSLHNLALRLDLPRTGFALTLEGRNLSDNQISDVSGFPLPGRTFYSTACYTR